MHGVISNKSDMTASDVSRVACGQTSRVKELLRQHARQDACRDIAPNGKL